MIDLEASLVRAAVGGRFLFLCALFWAAPGNSEERRVLHGEHLRRNLRFYSGSDQHTHHALQITSGLRAARGLRRAIREALQNAGTPRLANLHRVTPGFCHAKGCLRHDILR